VLSGFIRCCATNHCSFSRLATHHSQSECFIKQRPGVFLFLIKWRSNALQILRKKWRPDGITVNSSSIHSINLSLSNFLSSGELYPEHCLKYWRQALFSRLRSKISLSLYRNILLCINYSDDLSFEGKMNWAKNIFYDTWSFSYRLMILHRNAVIFL